MPLDVPGFVRKWQASLHTERSAAQQHFRDLCEALGEQHPTEADEIGNSYAFEKRVTKVGGGEGFADVWKRGFFAWEYKSKGGDLKAAYKQINTYHEALENPPLLIVCDFDHFEVHTKFENSPSRTYAFVLEDLLHDRDTPTCPLPPLEVLRLTFGDLNQLRPNVTSARVTEAAAADLLRLARELELERAANPQPYTKEQIAHFIMRLVFCLFADSVGLLRNHAFRKLVENQRFSPIGFNKILPHLFNAMSSPGGFFGADDVRYFNGDLFRPDDHILQLNQADLRILYSVSQHNWGHIEPSIFGTLFERSLDASKRSMIGAHYTSTDDILLLVEPVVMDPLRRRWEAVQANVLAALAEETGASAGLQGGSRSSEAGSVGLHGGSRGLQAPENEVQREGASAPGRTGLAAATRPRASRKPARRSEPSLKLNRPALNLLQDWAAELSAVRILDPACGSGNFLYVALKRLLDLWLDARTFGLKHGLTIALDPIPNPEQLFGIEIDFYAHEIASIVVWIGFLQWKHDHGINDEKEPLLRKLTNIQHADAIMRYDADGKPYEPEWPAADYIVSNPPFLGGKLLRRGLGDGYVDDLFLLYDGKVKAQADLVVYWFEKARSQMEIGRTSRVGLLSTQSIRGGANRSVLDRIKELGNIFMAWSDRTWLLEGATVHVSMVAFDLSLETHVVLDGQPVSTIHSDLTSGAAVTSARLLPENHGICFMGVGKVGSFELDAAAAAKMLSAPVNPNGRSNAEVVKPWMNALDITRRNREMYIIDFGSDMSESEAALFELPFQHLLEHVKTYRTTARSGDVTGVSWWLHQRSRPQMRRSLRDKTRYIATPRVTKHRLFVYLPIEIVPDNQLFAFARDDDYFFGVLHSSTHELWTRAQGTQLREAESGFRYTPNSTFDTFPFPWPPGKEPAESEDPRVKAIADAARELVRLRDAWLNPPGASEADLKDRTLTKLYNKRPEWLANAHRTLDAAVFAAYGWPADLTDQEILTRLLALNHERASAQASKS